MNKKIAEIYQDGVRFALWRVEGEGYVIYEDGTGTHHITAPNEEIAEGYFEDYVARLK